MIEDHLYSGARDEIAAVADAGFAAKWFSDLGIGHRPLTKADWL